MEFLAAVLASPVAVEDQAWLGLAPEPSHGQRVFDQARLHVRLKAPAHHLATEEIDHRSQIQPAFIRGNVGDVATPQPIGTLWREAPLHQVGGDGQAVAAVGGHHESALGPGPDAVLLHQPLNPIFTHPDASRQ